MVLESQHPRVEKCVWKLKLQRGSLKHFLGAPGF